MDTENLLKKIDSMIQKIYQSENEIYKDLDESMPSVQQHYIKFLEMIPELQKEGIEIDSNIILQQLKNLSAAIENKDTVLLYDTLQFEVKPLLEVYQEVGR